MTFDIPEIRTERLILRAPALPDFEALAAFYASDRSKFVGGPLTRAQTWRMLATELGHWPLRGYGRWSVEEKATGDFVGIVGPWSPEGWPEPEFGWDLMTGFEGRGFATEAARAARAYTYRHFGWTTAISLVAPGNDKSARLAERLGAAKEGEFTHDTLGHLHIWRHPGPESPAAEIAS